VIIAIDVAILPPPAVSQRAVTLSASLPAKESQGLRLGAACLPHITLLQQFVRVDALDVVLAQVGDIVARHGPLRLRVSGGGKGSSSVWMAVERTPPLVALHEDLLRTTESFEVGEGDSTAFAGLDARRRDVLWVRDYRRASSFAAFTPHITLGHASKPPVVNPIEFDGTRVAACHLGRFCTCQRILREWELGLV
jgi:2'-5' RNA ligase